MPRAAPVRRSNQASEADVSLEVTARTHGIAEVLIDHEDKFVYCGTTTGDLLQAWDDMQWTWEGGSKEVPSPGERKKE